MSPKIKGMMVRTPRMPKARFAESEEDMSGESAGREVLEGCCFFVGLSVQDDGGSGKRSCPSSLHLILLLMHKSHTFCTRPRKTTDPRGVCMSAISTVSVGRYPEYSSIFPDLGMHVGQACVPTLGPDANSSRNSSCYYTRLRLAQVNAT